MESLVFPHEHTRATARMRFFCWTGNFPSSAYDSCSPYSLGPCAIHRYGVAHQPSLRSLRTMMSYANSLAFREAGSLISFAVTAAQDYDPPLASPHRHHRFSAASGRGDRTLGNQSDRAT